MADNFEDDGEQTVTIDEYIKGLEDEELEADLVLGGDEGKECTYSKGYMKRQAIFSCLTCAPAGNTGVCTACSLTCHDGHEVVELWTKRKFRCDCGNSKFGELFCKLCPSKDPENVDNSYNKNFTGSYCICGRPYPDPNAEEQVEMIQCCICEDWFHENHLGLNSIAEIPRDEEGEPTYEEFICQDCALTFSFLKLYPSSIWATLRQKNPVISTDEVNLKQHDLSMQTHFETENGNGAECMMECLSKHAQSKVVATEDSLHGENTSGLNSEKASDIAPCSESILVPTTDIVPSSESILGRTPVIAPSSESILGQNPDIAPSSESILGQTPDIAPSSESILGQTPDIAPSSESILGQTSDIARSSECILGKATDISPSSECILGEPPKLAAASDCILGTDINTISIDMGERKPLFLSKKWRDLLCRCKTCSDFYKQKDIDYIIDSEDSLEEYEKMAKQKREENLQNQEGAELNFLDKLGHVQKIELLSGIADMKNELRSFMESFDSSKPVTSADIQGVFENLAKKKKQRLE
ncbi:E3 ubiquitin-protein ligase UBR7 protein [Dioscorea alata]|uniref:E3 ubiquitin-protein ligase UBR7 protein n=1 Tax=Dioscorea alata TaxID=55571 RepID=A0ACB7W495_DIOAL|nr:E3 ubiquitin-protein ligase UBR7 protein [Dioscorea alata]